MLLKSLGSCANIARETYWSLKAFSNLTRRPPIRSNSKVFNFLALTFAKRKKTCKKNLPLPIHLQQLSLVHLPSRAPLTLTGLVGEAPPIVVLDFCATGASPFQHGQRQILFQQMTCSCFGHKVRLVHIVPRPQVECCRMETPIKEPDVKPCQKVDHPESFFQAPAYSVASPNLGQGEAHDWQ